MFAVFFSTNLLISYWEICLLHRRKYIEERGDYWRKRQRESGKSPAVEFLSAKVTLARPFSPTLWADVWAAYSVYDGSYVDRRTFGFNCDIANGYFTPLPTLVLYPIGVLRRGTIASQGRAPARDSAARDRRG